MKVYIILDTYDNIDESVIIGVFSSEEKAKIELANYVLSGESRKTNYIYLVESLVGCD